MDYISTRGKAPKVSAATAIVQGIAPDGGLYVPENLPAYFPDDLTGKSYQQLAKEIFGLFLSDFSADEISEIVELAYNKQNFPNGMVGIEGLGNTDMLELWHGPTSAFKDMALQILPHLLTKSLQKTGGNKEIVILVATSGDTGTAALEGFANVPHTQVITFYPKDGVSAIQELQMNTTAGKNNYVVGVSGNFDDCQSGVKEIFANQQLAEEMAAQGKYFSSANSINWGRLLPQIVYYFYGYGQLVERKRICFGDAIDVAVPTGNFGNILAGWYAMRMGLPINCFYCASNRNNVLTEVLATGIYNRVRPFYKTNSPSMDILISSNFERFVFDISGNDSAYTEHLFYLLKNSGKFVMDEQIRSNFADKMLGGFAEEYQCAAAICELFEAYGYLMDPHTATGFAVAQRLRGHNLSGHNLLLLSTASPYKFPAAVLQAIDALPEAAEELQLPGILSQLSDTPIPAGLANLATKPITQNAVCSQEQMEAMVKARLGLA